MEESTATVSKAVIADSASMNTCIESQSHYFLCLTVTISKIVFMQKISVLFGKADFRNLCLRRLKIGEIINGGS